MRKSKVVLDDYSPLHEKKLLTAAATDNVKEPVVTDKQSDMVLPEGTVDKIAEKVLEKQQQQVEEKVEQKQQEEKVTAEKKVEQLIENPSRVLFTAKSIFPFDLFPDEIKVEELRVNIISRNFFASEQIQTVTYKELRKAEVETNAFFGTVRFITLTTVENRIEVTFLRRADALRVTKLVEGLRMLNDQGIDLSQISTTQLLEQVELLGSVNQNPS